MMNDPIFFWKNFRLGTELQISGSFIYNALYSFDKMENFYYEHEIFEFMYNIAVGIERLEKIAIILLEHSKNQNQEDFEKTLITHNHIELINRIKTKRSITLGKTHIKFLELIREFYKSIRYGRYSMASVYQSNQDKSKFISFVEEELDISINATQMFPTPVDKRVKKFIGKTIGKISSQLYGIIFDEAHRTNIHTYEIAYNTKAFKIFISKEYDFETERIAKKEILVHLLNKSENDGLLNFIKSIEPLSLNSHDSNEYVKFLIDFHNKVAILDEITYTYEESKFDKERFEKINAIGDDISFELPDEDYLNEDDIQEEHEEE